MGGERRRKGGEPTPARWRGTEWRVGKRRGTVGSMQRGSAKLVGRSDGAGVAALLEGREGGWVGGWVGGGAEDGLGSVYFDSENQVQSSELDACFIAEVLAKRLHGGVAPLNVPD